VPGKGAGYILAGCAVVALAMMTTPTLAADEGYRGWFLALDFASTQPESLDQHFANHFDTNTPPNDTRLVIDNDVGTSYRASVGYGFGNDLGDLRVSYWSFDHDDKMTGNLPGEIDPVLFGYGYIYAPYLNNPAGVDFTATSKVKAHAADLDYVRALVTGEKSSLSWLAGLRVASFEEDRGFEGNDGTNDFVQSKHFKSDGAGIRVGALANFGFGKHFSLESSFVMSLMQADTKGEAHIDNIQPPASETRTADDNHLRGEIKDFDVRAVWSYGKVDYYLGYSVSSWGGMVADPAPATTGPFISIGSVADRGRDNISFNSIHAGLVWRFKSQGFRP